MFAVAKSSCSFSCGQRSIGAACALAAILFAAGSAQAADLQVSNAWIAASDQTGVDVPLLMTIKTGADDADALLRIRCPVANFAEKHMIDRGEGAPAMRAIKSIPIPANKTTELKADGYHVMLLQTRQKLAAGDKFVCAVTFQKAGLVETEVQVRGSP